MYIWSQRTGSDHTCLNWKSIAGFYSILHSPFDTVDDVAILLYSIRAVAYASVTAIVEPFADHGPFERYPNLTACAFHAARGVPDD